MKALVEGPRIADPRPIFALGELAATPKAHSNRLSFRRNHAELHTAFRIDLWILFSTLVRRRRFPIIDRLIGLRRRKMDGENGSQGDSWEFQLHVVSVKPMGFVFLGSVAFIR